MNMVNRKPVSLADAINGIKDNPEARLAVVRMLHEVRCEAYQRTVTRFVAALALVVLTAIILTACAAHAKEPTSRDRIIATDVVEIVVSGNQTRITEVQSNTTHVFTSRRVIRRTDSPQPIPQAIDSGAIRIITHRGVIVVLELETGEIHII